MNSYEKILNYEAYIINLRQYFHKYPELSNHEFNTKNKIVDELKSMDISYETFDTATGIVATIKGDIDSDRTVGLRADMDALPIQENNDVAYRSINDGVMHACGHDCHMAMLLGAAKVINQNRDALKGTVKLIFQPAEENMRGARQMIHSGALDSVDSFLALHVWGDIESGNFGLIKGSAMAATDSFKIIVTGKGGHGATPHKTTDAIVVASEIVSNIQKIISRELNPLEPVVISIGKFNAGSRPNIIAEKATMEGSIRYFTKELSLDIENLLRRKVDFIAKSYGANASLVYEKQLPPVINSSSIIDLLDEGIKKIGTKSIPLKPLTISEDFSLMLDDKKGALAFLGIKNNNLKPILHSNTFNVDESALKYGAALYTQYAFDYLNTIL